ncbi:hypothetical protein GCM10009122_53170 [Fulvivirga kasyanovii]|uniref:hypothetical protein n=1 Tax=Fulvivirga kasyanovii TaxID=396812 RepID=UPI0012BC149A|nr:hypothetical protein [Fulvivirga kasyanovii]
MRKVKLILYLVRQLIEVAHAKGVKVGFLIENGIDSISFNPDAIIRGTENIAAAENK